MNVGEARTSSQRTKRTNKKSHQSVPNFNKANFFCEVFWLGFRELGSPHQPGAETKGTGKQ
jgi:hypothetical protein